MAHSLRYSSRHLAWLAMTAAMAVPLCAHADDRHTGTVLHRVIKGDTLEQLAIQYYGNPRLWTQLQQLNRVTEPRHLKPGSTLQIPVRYMPQQTAEVSFVQGSPTHTASTASGMAEPLKPGQKLPEGTSIRVPADSFVAVKLADGTIIRVQAESDIQLTQLRRKGRSGSLQSVLEMNRGGVNSSVGTEPDPSRRFDVRTQHAVTSVRGTQFEMALAEDGKALASVTEGTVAVQSIDARSRQDASAHGALITAGQGIAVSSDGQVGEPQTLLPSPDLSQVPEKLEDANFLSFQLPQQAQANAWQVQVARDESLSEVVRSGTFKTPQVRLKGVEDGTYYVAARAVDSHELPGMPTVRKVTVKTQPPPPLFQKPSPGGTISRTSGELVCTRVSGATSYRIQVATESGFANTVLDEVNQADCSARPGQLAPGNYLWRSASIRTLPNGQPDQGPFSQTQAFRLADSPPSLDTGALSANDEIPGIHLQWPGDTGLTYRLQMARSEDFADILKDVKLEQPAWSATDVAPGRYFVRIQTIDTATGLESPFSAAREVRSAAQVRSGFGLPLTSSDGTPLSRP